MVKILNSILLYGIICSISGADMVDAQKSMQDFVTSKKYNSSGFSVVIKDLETDSVVVKINENNVFNPASVSKLVTGAAAMDLLGTNHTFKTSVFLDQSINRDSGVVKGNLYIRGGGDPGFTAERLWLLVEHLHQNGIKKIEGDLVIDNSYFDDITVGPGFDEDSTSRAYQPLITALSVSFNTLAVHVRPGNDVGSPVYVDMLPNVDGVTIKCTAKTVAAAKNGALDVQTVAKGNKTTITVSGQIGIDDEPRYIYRKVWQTYEMAGGAIASPFSDRGVTFSGVIREQKTPDNLLAGKPFYVFESEPIYVFVNHMFKYSSNFAAEMIFKSIPAALDTSDKTPGSWQLGSQTVLSWWKNANLPGEPVIKNGSGMGNTNRISTGQMVALLSHVWNRKAMLPEYLSALSISGIDGTIKSRFKKSPLKGLIRGKTGTLNSYRVSTLAGYMFLPKGNYAFAVFCEKVGDGQWDNWVIQEQVLEHFYKSTQN
jgi:D-alanyl-D-alanine carboxypeptidase/D-alanyl-D-alanine-endopeptidase (penicillin-binding protein 4)